MTHFKRNVMLLACHEGLWRMWHKSIISQIFKRTLPRYVLFYIMNLVQTRLETHLLGNIQPVWLLRKLKINHHTHIRIDTHDIYIHTDICGCVYMYKCIYENIYIYIYIYILGDALLAYFQYDSNLESVCLKYTYKFTQVSTVTNVTKHFTTQPIHLSV
jgi:hypothetical protein